MKHRNIRKPKFYLKIGLDILCIKLTSRNNNFETILGF